MALDLRLQQKMSQQLVMTPQLQQAIKLLQLSHLEMAEVLRKEMEENPTLEEGEAHERSELDRSSEPEPAETRGEAEGDYEASGESYSIETPSAETHDAPSGGDYDQPDYEVLSSGGTASAEAPAANDGGVVDSGTVVESSPI